MPPSSFHELAADGTDDGNLEDQDRPGRQGHGPRRHPHRHQTPRPGAGLAASPPSPRTYQITENSRTASPSPCFARRSRSPPTRTTPVKASTAKPGVQEPIRPKPANAASKSVKVPPPTAPPQKLRSLPPSEQNTPSPVSNPPPSRPAKPVSQLPNPLTGQTALITGAAIRIGRAIALALGRVREHPLPSPTVALQTGSRSRDRPKPGSPTASGAQAVFCELTDPGIHHRPAP